MNQDDRWMARAIDLARHGEGYVEPNPMVGCVIVRDGQVLAEGFHRRFGEKHAESDALSRCADANGATAYVTLEPCSHHGKQPPCSLALVEAGVLRVVAAYQDPFAEVQGRGFEHLRQAGIEVTIGVLADEARALNAPYLKLVRQGKPWMIGKWACTLDGKIATASGSSQWISNESSRAVAHRLRGRCDGILIGRGTLLADDPTLTARPPGARIPCRIVLDSTAQLTTEHRLVRTVGEAPVLLVCGPQADQQHLQRLQDAGVEVLAIEAKDSTERLQFLLQELGCRRMTNVLVEGGGKILGSLMDLGEIDEVHAFVAPKLVGGAEAPGPVGGTGVGFMNEAKQLFSTEFENLDGDLYVRGRLSTPDV